MILMQTNEQEMNGHMNETSTTRRLGEKRMNIPFSEKNKREREREGGGERERESIQSTQNRKLAYE
jgi:hypothetical protein